MENFLLKHKALTKGRESEEYRIYQKDFCLDFGLYGGNQPKLEQA